MSTATLRNGSSTVPLATYGDPSPAGIIHELSSPLSDPLRDNAQEHKSPYLPKFEAPESSVIAHEILDVPTNHHMAEIGDDDRHIFATSSTAVTLDLEEQGYSVTKMNSIDVEDEAISSSHQVSDRNEEAVEGDPTAMTNQTDLPTHMPLLNVTRMQNTISSEMSETTRSSIVLNHQEHDKSPSSKTGSSSPEEFDVIDDVDGSEDNPALQTVVVPQIFNYADDFDVTGRNGPTRKSINNNICLPLLCHQGDPNSISKCCHLARPSNKQSTLLTVACSVPLVGAAS